MNTLKAPTKFPKAAMPFLSGTVAGALLAIVLGFTNGWVVTTSARDIEVQDASVNAQAAVCASMAQAHLKATKSTVSLDGYKAAARKARADLAHDFAVALPGEKVADSIVINACAFMLNGSRV